MQKNTEVRSWSVTDGADRQRKEGPYRAVEQEKLALGAKKSYAVRISRF